VTANLQTVGMGERDIDREIEIERGEKRREKGE
jgi:hypothetical protein